MENKKLKTMHVHPSLLVPNPWNSNVMTKENEAKLENSIRRNGLYDNIITRKLDDGTYQILGGAHRAKIAERIGHTEIPIVALEGLSDSRAKEISLTHNFRYGSDDTLRLADIMNSLDDAHLLADFTPYSEIEIETFMSATKIDMESLMVLDDDDINIDQEIPTEKAPKTHTIMRFKVPIEDASAIQEIVKEVMKKHGFTESDALTNAGDALVHLLLGKES